MVATRVIGEVVGSQILHACSLVALAHCTEMRGGVILYPICGRRVLPALLTGSTWKDGSVWIGGGSTGMCASVSTDQIIFQWAKHLELSATV